MAVFTEADLDALEAPHVCRAWFAEIHLPTGTRRLHTGLGPLPMGGHQWEGVSDPFGGQLVSMQGMEEPAFGQAVAVDIVLSGANRLFFADMFESRHAIEGVRCDLSFAVVDQETGDVLIPLRKLFPGKLTSPRFPMIGTLGRAVVVRVVSLWEGLNFPSAQYMWSPAGQRERYPGDQGMDLINADIVEEYKA